jgi:uncharacterized protein
MVQIVKKLLKDNTWTAKAKRTATSVLPVDKRRRGKCLRCGACCHLPVRCAFLSEDENGQYSCTIWRFRPLNCRKYPRTRSELLTKKTCGYYFGKKNRNPKLAGQNQV